MQYRTDQTCKNKGFESSDERKNWSNARKETKTVAGRNGTKIRTDSCEMEAVVRRGAKCHFEIFQTEPRSNICSNPVVWLRLCRNE